MTDTAAAESFAVEQRRKSRREEWNKHIKLAGLLTKYLDPACAFWTSLENKPISRISDAAKRGSARRFPSAAKP